MDISLINLAIGLVLMLVAIGIFHIFRVNVAQSTIIAATRMVVQMFLIGIYLKYLFEWNNAYINVAWVLIMAMVAASTAIGRTGLRARLMFLPICVAFTATAFVIGLYFLIFVLRLGNPFDARYFIPTMGILLGNMLGVNVMGLNTYYSQLIREQGLYHYMIGNGATIKEAVCPFIREALEKAFAPAIANMAVMGLVALPGTMIGQILGGSSPEVAIKYQIMIVVITFCASVISLVLTIRMSFHFTFDTFGRLKSIKKASN